MTTQCLPDKVKAFQTWHMEVFLFYEVPSPDLGIVPLVFTFRPAYSDNTGRFVHVPSSVHELEFHSQPCIACSSVWAEKLKLHLWDFLVAGM
jgi:hypothetical protein